MFKRIAAGIAAAVILARFRRHSTDKLRGLEHSLHGIPAI